MEIASRSRLSGLPLALQILGLLLGGLIVAQIVTLFLTFILPPAPPPQYSLDVIARALSGEVLDTSATRPLQRRISNAPPSLSGPGWLTADFSRHDLARLLGRKDDDVQLYFYTPLPFAGTAAMPRRDPLVPPPDREQHTFREMPGIAEGGIRPVQFTPSPSEPRFPGGGFPGGFPGGGFPGGLPGGTMPGGLPGPRSGNIPGMRGGGMPGGQFPRQGIPQAPGGATMPPNAELRPAPETGSGRPTLPDSGLIPHLAPVSPNMPLPAAIPPMSQMQMRPLPPEASRVPMLVPSMPAVVTETPPKLTTAPPPRPLREPVSTVPSRPQNLPPQAVTSTAPAMSAPAPAEREGDAAISARPVPRMFPPISLTPPRSLFGLLPAPFVEGDFVAALHLADDRWAIVQPTPEPFPNGWQKRVFLWFAISFAMVAPFGWLFARRVVRPLTGFATAAERLGRDPTKYSLALEGPAEVGRAANAFNRMQSRLRSFVDDRTAMIGAISHDLRTPLTRLRFRIEEAPDDIREGMLGEVEEMEQMIASVLSFIRDGTEPGARELVDLQAIVEDVVEDAVFVGKRVTIERSEVAEIEADPLGMRRLLTNLIDNAVKYGEDARVRLFLEQQDVVAEVQDNGPGLPEEELERVFEPFYRAPSARISAKQGNGLGLAVCRSIARAHGGDVKLARADKGLIAQLRLPLAYGAAGA